MEGHLRVQALLLIGAQVGQQDLLGDGWEIMARHLKIEVAISEL